MAAWVRERLPAVQTYGHAAGAVNDCSIVDMTAEAYWGVCQPKVMGALLAEAFPSLQAQHLFSSTAAVWSQPGAAHYSSANACLNAYANLSR